MGGKYDFSKKATQKYGFRHFFLHVAIFHNHT